MRSHGVVVDAPGLDDARLREAHKPVLVQALVTTLPIETLDVGVFDRFARTNETQFDAVSIGPRIQGAAAEFRSVVTDDHLRQTTGPGEPLEDAHHARARQRAIDFDRDTLAREVIDDVQQAKPATASR